MRIALLLLLATPAFADEEVVAQRTALWPATVEVHALVGGEFHGSRGSPVAMGIGGEFLWKGRIGGFAELLASQGTSLLPAATADALSDRISLPLGFAARPFAHLVEAQSSWWQRMVASIGVQIGISMEHLRVSDDEQTKAAFHFALSAEIPVYRGPMQGGLALKLYGRLIATSQTLLDQPPPNMASSQKLVRMEGVGGQLFAGLVWYP